MYQNIIFFLWLNQIDITSFLSSKFSDYAINQVRHREDHYLCMMENMPNEIRMEWRMPKNQK